MPELTRVAFIMLNIKVLATAIAGVSITAACAAFEDGTVVGRSPTVWDGIYTIEQAGRGQKSVDKHCAGCHGGDLRGSRGAPAMAGMELLFVWDGRSLGELFEFMRTTMPPGQAGVLSDQAYADVLATMLQRSGFPAGNETELSANPQEIAQVMIRRENPY